MPVNTEDLYIHRLRRFKWIILGLVALTLVVLQVHRYLVQGMLLVDDLINGLIGMAIAVVLIECGFRAVVGSQRRLQQEIAERMRAEVALQQRDQLSGNHRAPFRFISQAVVLPHWT